MKIVIVPTSNLTARIQSVNGKFLGILKHPKSVGDPSADRASWSLHSVTFLTFVDPKPHADSCKVCLDK